MCEKMCHPFENVMLFIPYIFVQSIYHPNDALCDTSLTTYINSHIFRHQGTLLRESLWQMYVNKHANLNLMFIGLYIIVIVEEQKTNLMSLAILFHCLCAQHVSDINISIIRSLQLFCSITTLVVLFLVRCVLEFGCGWVGMVSVLQAVFRLQHGYHSNPTTPKLQHTSNQEQYE